MGVIENVVKLFTKQKCTYWGNPVSDGKGGYTFDAAVEINCRWDDRQEIRDYYEGNKFTSQSTVMVEIDIKRGSYLGLGTLASFQTIATANGYSMTNPVDFPEVFIVIQFDKIPMAMKDDDFVRIAYTYDKD